MLTEWLTYIAADCTPPARKLGYLRESIAIRSRYRRCRTAWQPHLEHNRFGIQFATEQAAISLLPS